jgi:hypothetical protein
MPNRTIPSAGQMCFFTIRATAHLSLVHQVLVYLITAFWPIHSFESSPFHCLGVAGDDLEIHDRGSTTEEGGSADGSGRHGNTTGAARRATASRRVGASSSRLGRGWASNTAGQGGDSSRSSAGEGDTASSAGGSGGSIARVENTTRSIMSALGARYRNTK